MSLAGKVVFVTGGAAGIGKATCEGVLAEGGRVAAVDVNAATVDAVRKEWIGRFGVDRVWCSVVDVLDPTAFEHAVRSAVAYFGGQLHGFINNAGIVSAIRTAPTEGPARR
jgi:NAD(P)-dependent dehydrogenase (short-subunit alcohol dehydrogenase family)